MDYGTAMRYMRENLPLQVLKGFYPTEPVKLSSLAAPAALSVDSSVAIKSGMAIKKNAAHNFRATIIGDNAAAGSIFIALHDSDSHDVQASGKLVGLDCSDTFEVQTGYFAAGNYAMDDPLTVAAGGLFAKATTNDIIVGYISAVGTNLDGTIPYTGKTPSATATTYIQFKTAQNGQKA